MNTTLGFDADLAADGLPPGWVWVPVESLAANETGALTDGPFGSNLKSSHYKASGPRVIRLQNIGDGVFNDEQAHITREHFDQLRKHEARGQDVVVAMLGEKLPRACVVPDYVGPAIVKADCARLRVDPGLALPGLVAAGLNSPSLRYQADELVHGVGRPRLGLRWLKTLQFPLAPFPEQHRIVEAIESYFTRLDDAVATLERVQRNLKRYRASVLKAAVEGRLVPTEADLARAEGRDYEPALALLERILAERRRRWQETGGRGKYQEPVAPETTDLPELSEGWCWATMDYFVYAIDAGKNFRCIETPPGPSDVGVVKVSAVTWGAFDEDESKTCPRPDFVNEAHLISPGDFLISRANTIQLVGACVIVNAIQRRLMLSDKILRLRTVGDVDRWLLWVLRSALGRHEIESLATGNQESMRNIGQEGIRRIRIPVPPEAECRRISAEIEHQMSVFEHSKNVLQGSERRCQRLRQSILKWAFEGKLADQDPSDEPAGALLERIRLQTSASRHSASDADVGQPRRAKGRRHQLS